jgi:hypothetical protein
VRRRHPVLQGPLGLQLRHQNGELTIFAHWAIVYFDFLKMTKVEKILGLLFSRVALAH